MQQHHTPGWNARRLASLFLLVTSSMMAWGPVNRPARAQEHRPANARPLRVIVFGAHFDDCELSSGGTAARWVKLGSKVKFVSVTNGDIGHHQLAGAILARRRTAEVKR